MNKEWLSDSDGYNLKFKGNPVELWNEQMGIK